MGFSWQEYWSGLPCPPPGDLPITGKEPTFLMSPALASGLFTTSDILEAPVSTKYQSVWFLVAYIKITILCSNTLPWIIALLWWRGLHSSMKLWAMLYRATQDKQIIVKSADKRVQGGRGGKPVQYSCHRNPMSSVKRQKDTTPEDEPLPLTRSESVQYALGKDQRAITNSSERMKQLSQSRNDVRLWMSLVVKVKTDAIKTILHRNLEC